jgi:glycosyltransferase involved in cell wall biosynthesis
VFQLRRGRVDLPAACFNQYNVLRGTAIQLFEPIEFGSHSDKGRWCKMNKELEALERKLEIRNRELMEAHGHIAALEEKLLKLKGYRRELKLLKEERRRLRQSAERRVGQIFLRPYRLLAKIPKTLWKRFYRPNRNRQKTTAPSEYQRWFEQHRATAEELASMRLEVRAFASQPLVSILTPVFDPPVPWLREAMESVLAQVYENWELLLIDDGSSDVDLLRALPALAARDRRIRLVRLESHQGISAALNRGLSLANGEWIAFLDHDDVLEADALFQNVRLLQENPELDLIYSDEDKLTDQGFDSPILKPDWSPDFFLSCNYLCHMIFLRRDLVREVGGFQSQFDGSQDYDLLLRVSERTNRIHHIPRVLYHWRRSENSSASDVRQKPGQLEASQRAIEAHLERRGEEAHVAVDWRSHAFYVRRELCEARKISIVIPNFHGWKSLERCLESVVSRTSYPNYDIVIVQMGEREEIAETATSLSHRVLYFADPVNDSAAKNYAVAHINSPWLLFLDDKVEAIDPDWLTIMAEYVQRPEIGAVGPRLINPGETIEHAGLVLGVNGIAQSAFRGFPAEHSGVNRQLQMTRNYSAVSSACLLMRREVFQQMGGFDERLSGSLADVDLCLKMRCAGYLIVYTPLAKLRWDAVLDKSDVRGETIMRERWSHMLERDPYYNPNLSRERADFSLRK